MPGFFDRNPPILMGGLHRKSQEDVKMVVIDARDPHLRAAEVKCFDHHLQRDPLGFG